MVVLDRDSGYFGENVEIVVVNFVHVFFILLEDGIVEGDVGLEDGVFIEASGGGEGVSRDTGEALGKHSNEG